MLMSTWSMMAGWWLLLKAGMSGVISGDGRGWIKGVGVRCVRCTLRAGIAR